MEKKKIAGAKYVEPTDYIPKEIRKKYKLGEYNDEFNRTKKRNPKKKKK